jgi:hypothetical protein
MVYKHVSHRLMKISWVGKCRIIQRVWPDAVDRGPNSVCFIKSHTVFSWCKIVTWFKYFSPKTTAACMHEVIKQPAAIYANLMINLSHIFWCTPSKLCSWHEFSALMTFCAEKCMRRHNKCRALCGSNETYTAARVVVHAGLNVSTGTMYIIAVFEVTFATM